jgi:hypothetical protein
LVFGRSRASARCPPFLVSLSVFEIRKRLDRQSKVLDLEIRRAPEALKSCFGIGEIGIGLREKSYRSPGEATIGIRDKTILVSERTSTRVLREAGIGIVKSNLSDSWRSGIGRRENGIWDWG